MKLCKYPFTRLTIEYGGKVSFCCPAYNDNYFIGNIHEDSFEDLWYGEKAREFRISILDGSYRYCNLDVCGDYVPVNMLDSNDVRRDLLDPCLPKEVNLSYSPSCNVRCATCRDDLMLEQKEDTEYYNKINEKIIKLCSNASLIYLNGGGEVFTSNHFKTLLRGLVEQNPHLKFILHTNGLLCDAKHLQDFGLTDRIYQFIISIHGATKSTYEKIVRGGIGSKLSKICSMFLNLKNKERCLLFIVCLLFIL